MPIKPMNDGRFRVVVWGTDPDTKRRKKWERLVASHGEALELEAQWLELREGRVPEVDDPSAPGYSPTFATFARRWLRDYSRVNNKRSHWTKQDHHLQRYLLPRFGRVRLADIKPGDIEKFKRQLVAERGRYNRVRRPGTVNRVIACLRKVLATAVDWGVLTESPMRRVKSLREDPPEMHFLTRDEIPRFVNALPERYRPLAIVAIQTGLRQGELFGLRWEDVDWERNLLRVCRSRSAFGLEDTLKTKGSRRQIPMSADVRNLLRAWAGESAQTGWIISDMSIEGVRHAMARANRTWGGGKHIRFHDFRHTFASHLVLNGTDLMTVMRLLGHANLAMVARYSHLSDQHRVDAISNTWGAPATVCENGTVPNSPLGSASGGVEIRTDGKGAGDEPKA